MKEKALGSLLAIEPLPPQVIVSLLEAAKRMDLRHPRPLLKGRRVALLFYESSTRTRTSFEIAAKALGAHTTLITSIASSIEKGESLMDTGRTLRAIGADAIVIRHPSSGAPNLLARDLRYSHHQCRRRHARASFAGAAGRLHHLAAQDANSKA